MTTDSEPFHNNNHKDVKWITHDDKIFIDSIDKAIIEHDEIDNQLDNIYKSIPCYENPIKIIKNFEKYYATLSDDSKKDFLVDLERELYVEDSSEITKSAIKTFFQLVGYKKEHESN